MADCFFVAVTAVTNDMSGSHGSCNIMAHGSWGGRDWKGVAEAFALGNNKTTAGA